MNSVLNDNIFNVKRDYNANPLFLGESSGLVDSINKRYPKIWSLYKKLKSLDWDENEFDFSACNTEFKKCSKSVYDIMIRTLAWQWEADSVVARKILGILSSFITSDELYAAMTEVCKNEIVHALTYSEIVRVSFDNPDSVMEDILKETEPLQRLKTVTDSINEAYLISHKYALGEIDNNQETYNAVFMLFCTLLVLERIQFMSSFAVTFSMADAGMFVPIANAVQKICQDEFEIHCKIDLEVINNELKTERGMVAFTQCRDKIQSMIDEVVESELVFADWLFSNGRELVGITPELLKQNALFNAKPVYDLFFLDSKYTLPDKNPMPFLEHWININSIQASPQEERDGAYMVGAVINSAVNSVYDIDDL